GSPHRGALREVALGGSLRLRVAHDGPVDRLPVVGAAPRRGREDAVPLRTARTLLALGALLSVCGSPAPGASAGTIAAGSGSSTAAVVGRVDAGRVWNVVAP